MLITTQVKIASKPESLGKTEIQDLKKCFFLSARYLFNNYYPLRIMFHSFDANN